MKLSKVRKGFVIIIIILFIGASLLPSTVAIIKEKSNTTFSSFKGYIQDLIDDAIEGDTVNIPSGTYYENLIINKTINLVGEDKESTIIMPAMSSRDILFVSANWVNISGFTIRKGGGEHYGIEIISNYNTINDNIISNNYGIGLGIFGMYNDIIGNDINSNEVDGIELQSCSDTTIRNNNILENPIGIELVNSINNLIDENIISDNEYGIIIEYNSHSNTITGNTISFTGNYGIQLYSYDSNIENNDISENNEGIIIEYNSNNNNINSNYFSDNKCGINLGGSDNNIIGNSFSNDGISIFSFYYNNVEDNMVNGKPLIYLEDESNSVIDVDAGQIILINCDNIEINNQEITNTHIGIILINSEYCIISDNDISFNNENAIDLYLSNNNSINGNTIDSNSLNGINIGHSSHNTIKNNYILNSEFGVYITSSYHNTIKGNEIDLNNGSGITIIDSDFNNIQSNNLSDNAYGFRCLSLGSYDNIIYHNNFLNNAENAFDKSDRGNTWDDGKYGNFWSDYKQKYPNAKKLIMDGIWDTPYEIPTRDNKDNCPLLRQWPKSSSNTIQITFSKIYFLLQWLIDRYPILEKLLF